MKAIRIIAAAAALMLTTGCMDFSFLFTGNIEEPVPPEVNSRNAARSVADEMHSSGWYSELCESMAGFSDTSPVSEIVSNKDVKKAIYQLRSDHPEFFWMGSSYYTDSGYNGSEINISYTFDLDEREIPRMYVELQAAADRILRDAPDGSDYDKILYVHDYITENTVYDHEAAETMKIGLSGTAYGCLVKGKAVCGGYSAAFIYLMNYLGIESGFTTGSNHAWNWVKLDGEYYWIDVTWDDMDYENYNASHKFFLISDEQLLGTREFDWTQAEFPECKIRNNNYFTRNGGYFTEYDEKAVIDYIESRVGETHCEIMFADFDSYKAAIDGLFGKLRIRRVKGMDLSQMRYIRTDEMFSVDIIFRIAEVTGDED